MKVQSQTPVCLVLEAKPWGMGFVIALVVSLGLAAGSATLSMHETMSWSDDFVRLGLGILAGTLLVGTLLVWVSLRVRRLTLDARYDEIRYESKGLGRTKETLWPLHGLATVEVGEVRRSSGEVSHFTVLRWKDGEETRMRQMDPPTVQQIERNTRTINQWLEALRTQHP